MTDVHRLFFAIRPDPEARSMAVGEMQRKIDVHSLSGRRVPPERLHVTLHWLGDYSEIPPELLDRAQDAGGAVEMAPFDVGFDRIGSLGVALGGLALTGCVELKALRQLRRVLTATLKAAGIGHHVRRGFSPHVSLLYGRQHVAPQPIAPIRWAAKELVLIESLVGCGKHIDLHNWPLQSRQLSFSDW